MAAARRRRTVSRTYIPFLMFSDYLLPFGCQCYTDCETETILSVFRSGEVSAPGFKRSGDLWNKVVLSQGYGDCGMFMGWERVTVVTCKCASFRQDY